MARSSKLFLGVLALAAIGLAPLAAEAQLPRPVAAERPGAALAGVPDLRPLVGLRESELAPVVARFNTDHGAATRGAGQGAQRRQRLETFYNSWLARLRELDFAALSREAQVDYLLLSIRIRTELKYLGDDAAVEPAEPEFVPVSQGQTPPLARVRPIGARALQRDLDLEMIPYTAAELVAIAEREFAWCEREMERVAAELGYDDWLSALEYVKDLYVPPGRQPDAIRDLAEYSHAFVKERNLISVPPLAEEVWRQAMMSPQRQLVNPFFTGGETITISYPTHTMAHEDKLMSMRGNNPHFSVATVHHELIPGHHLQGFMTSRYNTHRQVFSTPFWGEGWALYWEMLLWDHGFARSPEDEVGMLFWRSHRAARIIFSLSYHLGTMTPEECVDLLVQRVGHERANAEAEVRRSFQGNYSPLYQVAYMLGGLQLRALHEELVGSGRMTDRQYHDLVIQGGRMPIEMVRARVNDIPLRPDYLPSWRFAGEPLGE